MKDFLKVAPHPYQVEGIHFARKHHYCMIGDEPGLGKTLQALIIAFEEIAKGKKILIVVPPFLRINWWLEIDKLAVQFYEIMMIEKRDEIVEIPSNIDIVILGYSMVKESEHIFRWADMCIADEAHYLKNIEANVTTDFHKFIYENMMERLILLTGTPIPNGSIEFYSPLRLLGYSPKATNGKNVFNDYEIPYAFYKEFAISRDTDYGTVYEGLKNAPLLKTYLKDKYIRRKCSDVLDLPELVEKDVLVAYGNDTKLAKEFTRFNSDDSYSPPAKAKSALLKAVYTAEYAQNLFDNGNGSIIVFTDHVDSCLEIARRLKCPHIKGGVPTKKRAQLVAQIQNKELDFLVITIGAGSEGVNLTEAQHTVVNDPSWVPAKNEQLRKRTHRIGQNKTCYIHNILGSVQDKKILRTLRRKMKVIGELL